MQDTEPAARPLIPIRASSARVVVGLIALLIGLTAAQIGFPGMLGQGAAFVDFHVFHLAGKLALNGGLSTAYHAADFAPLQEAQPGYSAFMPYTYPPQYNFVAALLGALPQGLAYLLFVGGGFAAWVYVLIRLAGAQAGVAVLMILPGAVVCARFGQNGFLSAALIGAFCLLALRGRDRAAGVPLGLMAYKPHLGLGIALAALFAARWWTIAVAAGVTVAAFGAATLVFGPGVWGDFRDAAGESAMFLEAGAYPLFRMTSVYAMLRSLGASAELAMLAHVGVAVLAVAALGLAARGDWGLRRVVVLGVLCCQLISPYNYDYDMTIGAVAVALAAPDLARLPGAMRGLVVAAYWLASGSGLFQLATGSAPAADRPTFAALGMLCAGGLIWHASRRGARPRA